MYQSAVRAAVAWQLLLSHLVAIFSAPFLIIDFEWAMDVILIMCPLTGAFVLIIVQHYAEAMNQNEDTAFRLNRTAAELSIFLCLVLSVAVIGVQVLFWFGKIGSIDQLKRAVALIDTVIGGYTAILIKKLFSA